jgi:HEAT repeat protein
MASVSEKQITKWKEKKNLKRLLKAAASDDRYVSNMATNAIKEISDIKNILIDTLSGKKAIGKIAALKVLSIYEDEQLIDPVIKTLEDDNYIVSVEAAAALHNKRSPKVVSKLIEQLGREGKELNEAAMDSLIALKDIARDDIVQAAQKNPSSKVRRNAVLVMSNIKEPAIVNIITNILKNDQAKTVKDAAEKALKAMGSIVQDKVIPLLDDKDLQLYACRIIGEVGDVKAIDPLLKVLDDDDVYNLPDTIDALNHIGNIGNTKIVDRLIKILDHENLLGTEIEQAKSEKDKEKVAELQELRRDIKRITIKTLGHLGDSRIVDPLIRSLNNSYLRDEATIAIINYGESAITKALKQDEWFKKDLVYALKKIGTKKANDLLKKVDSLMTK